MNKCSKRDAISARPLFHNLVELHQRDIHARTNSKPEIASRLEPRASSLKPRALASCCLFSPRVFCPKSQHHRNLQRKQPNYSPASQVFALFGEYFRPLTTHRQAATLYHTTLRTQATPACHPD